MNLSDLIRAAGPLLGLPDLTLNAEGVCALQIEGGIPLMLENSPLNEAVLYAEVAQSPDQDRDKFFAALLEAQLFGRELPPGCCFGLRSDTGGIFLNRVFDAEDFDAEKLVDLLTEFNRWAGHWHDKLSGVQGADAADSDRESSTSLRDGSHPMGLRI